MVRSPSQYVALLRGINVGGNNLIKMDALRVCFERQGLGDVATYIASGNVLFSTLDADPAELTAKLEAALAARFSYRASLVLRSREELRKVVAKAPMGFGAKPAEYRYDVVFLKESLTAREAVKDVPMREGVDVVTAGPGVLYGSRLIRLVSKSMMPKLIRLPIYKEMTIRNWNTTTKLLALLEAR